MKISTIRNALIRQTIISTVILGVIGGAVFYISSVDEECDASIISNKSAADNISRQATELSDGFGKASSIQKDYNEIRKKLDKKNLTINRNMLRDVIAESRSRYFIDSLDVKLDAINPVKFPDFNSEVVSLESTQVTIGLNALTDLDILGLIETLDNTFWGIKTTSLQISLSKELSNELLIEIKDKGFSPLVNAKIVLTLFGFHDNTKNISDALTGTGGEASPNKAGQP